MPPHPEAFPAGMAILWQLKVSSMREICDMRRSEQYVGD
jgi:hypothetical protein